MNHVNFESEGVSNDFRSVGRFNVMEAQRLCEKLEKECVRFFVLNPNSQTVIDPIIAAHGGTFGSGESIEIVVHREDREQFDSVFRDVLIPSPEKTKSFLDIFRSFGRHECD